MARKQKPQRKKQFRPENLTCFFCDAKKNPDYKDYVPLAKFVSDRAKIVGKKRSGVCSRHQRKLTVEIKRARHLGLLPFSPSL